MATEGAHSMVRLAVAWPAKVAEEVLLMPWTLARVRHSLTELPDRIDTLTETLGGTIDTLNATLPAVDRTLGAVAINAANLEVSVDGLIDDLAHLRVAIEQLVPNLMEVVSGMESRVHRVETTVTELGDALLGVMGSIPGVRRSLRARPVIAPPRP